MEDLSGRKYKVLIVDDSETNRTILAEILRGEYDITKLTAARAPLIYCKRISVRYLWSCSM